MRRPPVLHALVALLVVLSGCAGVLDPGRETATTTAEPATARTPPSTTTIDETEREVYAILAEGVPEAGPLADAHAEGLEGRSFERQRVTVVRAPNGTVLARLESVGRTNASRERFVYSATVSGDPSPLVAPRGFVVVGAYSNGTATFLGLRRNGTTRYGRYSPENSPYSGDLDGYRRVRVEFGGVDVRLDSVVRREGGRRYRVVSTGRPHGFGGPNVSDVRLVAFVAPDGVVRERRLNYTGVRDGRRVRVERTATFAAIDGTTVDPPPWLAEARNRTAPVGDG